MTIRVYLYRGGMVKQEFRAIDPERERYYDAYWRALFKWGERVKIHQGALWGVVLDVWLEFDTEEEAALFKLTEL